MEAVNEKNINQPSHYVGVGASAGGLEAIDLFFSRMPSDSGLAFIVIQHLSPDYKSLMVELLSKKTDMPVHRAAEGMAVEANNIYLIPPKNNLTIFHGKLLLKQQDASRGINLPIDIFLRSLAEDQAERAIAVILSGTGSDGTRGVRAVKEFGGMVMVQDPESAKFDGMPRAAISSGVADFIISPEEMPDQLTAFVKHPYVSREKRTEPLLGNQDGLARIFAELREKTRVDFTYYKPSTITRRIERRMTVNRIDDFGDYVRYLQSYPGEVMTLYRELLIGVTSFFRDSDAMEELGQRYLPELLQRVKNREIRFWIAGCSTGEEAYSLAILAREAMESARLSRDIKIFATDIDRDAIMSASHGAYPESIAADLNPRLLAKYFYRREDNYQISRNVREMVVFAQHNLVKDPPFTNIDLVSCRNLLIYLQPVLQKKALDMFNFSLNTQGLLFLGSSETVGEMAEYFETLHHKHKIFRCKGRVQAPGKEISSKPEEEKPYWQQSFVQREGRRRYTAPEEDRIVARFLDAAASRYIPFSVIVNEQMEIMHIVGDPGAYLKVPSGRAAFDITKMAAKDLAIPLATGIQKVFRTQEEITYTNVRLKAQEENRTIQMRMAPLPERKGSAPLAVVFFEEVKVEAVSETTAEANYDFGEETQQRIMDLELELQFARENLQATIEELETSNEELQATNEELLASNEELQSTNEELQSTNEELYTVNAEYQNKIMELTELNNDVDNLLTSSRIGTLLLDEDLGIRKYSPEITKIFNLMDKDIGRPVSHLSHRLLDFDPVAAARLVQKDNRSMERQVQSEDERTYLARILPYHIGPNTFSGVVFTFVDISELKNAQIRLRQSQRSSQDITHYMPAGLFIYNVGSDGKLHLEDSNPEAERITGIAAEQWKGKTFDEIWPQAKESGVTERFMKVLENKETCYLENVAYQDGRVQGVYRIHAFALPGPKLAVSFEDISENKRMEAKLRESEARYTNLFETMAQGVVYQDATGNIISCNPSAQRILGLTKDQMLGRTSMDPRWKAIREDGSPLPGDQHPSMVALHTGKPVYGFIMGVLNPQFDNTRWIMVNAIPEFRDGEQQPCQVYATFEDVTDRINYEKTLLKDRPVGMKEENP